MAKRLTADQRVAKLQEERQAKREFAEEMPPTKLLRQLRAEGATLSQILPVFNRRYLPPEGQDVWLLHDVAYVAQEAIPWPM